MCHAKSRGPENLSVLFVSFKEITQRTATKDMGLLGLTCVLEAADCWSLPPSRIQSVDEKPWG